ncbi:MAG TPA: hypothetical protein PLB91_06935 [Spirochaetales bacterium]|nr:hypothetical protein [Spirochaetales bacterium]HRY52997.1 hypothetical protein [Spirochaetia bacterium]
MSLESAAEETGLKLEEAKSNIAIYEAFLQNFANTERTQKDNFESKAKADYSALVENMGLADVAAAASGRSGSSVQAIGNQAREKVAEYAGADLSLGGKDGGLYELNKTELENDLASQRTQAEGQLDVLKRSVPVLEKTMKQYQKAAKKADNWFSSIFS